MRFSRRTNWNTEESTLARAHRLRVQAGLPIADLTASNPTRCGFTILKTFCRPSANPQALDYDPQPRGSLPPARPSAPTTPITAPAVKPEPVILTTSTSEAYSFLFRLLCDPGTEILAPQPGYPLFDFLAVLDDVALKSAPLVYDHGWQIDPEGLRRAITPAHARHRARPSQQPHRPLHQALGSEELAEPLPRVRSFPHRRRGLSRLLVRRLRPEPDTRLSPPDSTAFPSSSSAASARSPACRR
jgi:alanine-synthesizing transaminase